MSNRFALSSSSLLSSLASLGSASAGACAGGVCTVAVQTASTLAASSASLSSLATTAPSVLPFWERSNSALAASHVAAPPTMTLPWWMQLLIVLLLASTGFTVYQLHGYPKVALLAGGSGLLAAVAELRWLPGGLTTLYPVLGFALPGLVLAPWLPKLHWRSKGFHLLAFVGILLACLPLLGAFALQWFLHWQPCVLCWVQRAAFLGVGIGFLLSFRHYRQLWKWLTGACITLGGIAAITQYLETQHSQAVQGMADVCTKLSTVSCSAAGSKILLGWPIAVWSIACFAVLWTILLLLRPAKR